MASLPVELSFNQKATASPTTAYKVSVRANSSNAFLPGDPVSFDIPTRKNNFINGQNCYLKFTVTPSADFTLDYSAYSFLARQTIKHSSNTVEDILQYQHLAVLMLDWTSDVANTCVMSNLMGLSEKAPFSESNSSRHGCTISAGVSRTFTLPIISGLFTLCDKYLPIGALVDSLSVEYTLNTIFGAGVGDAAATWFISNPTLELEYIELSNEAAASIISPFMQIHGTSARVHVSSPIPAGVSGAFPIMIPARYTSLQSLHTHFRVSGSANSNTNHYNASAVKSKLGSYQYRVGNLTLPQQPVDCRAGYSNAFAENLKSWHSFGSNSHGSQVRYIAFNYDGEDHLTDPHWHGFCASISTSSFSNKSSVMQSGMNTMGSNSFLDCIFDNVTGTTLVAHTTAVYDVMFVIQDGLLTSIS